MTYSTHASHIVAFNKLETGVPLIDSQLSDILFSEATIGAYMETTPFPTRFGYVR